MANELIHKSVGTQLTQAEFEAIDGHTFNNQATGDLLYASSATQLSRLGIGAANDVLTVTGGIPAWSAEILPSILQAGRLWIIPPQAGWTEVIVGTADSSLEAALMWVREQAINSSVVRYAGLQGMGAGAAIGIGGIDWGKKIRILFLMARGTSVADSTARFQLKQEATVGALATPGLELLSSNLVLSGESYGSIAGTVDLGTTLTDALPYQIEIIHYPAVKIEWYVNKVLKGTQSTATKIPSGQLDVNTRFVVSMASAGTSGNGMNRLLSPVYIWQEF